MIESYGEQIVMQWIPSLSNIPGNDKGDKKTGLGQEQIHTQTTYKTIKQIIQSYYKDNIWEKRQWVQGEMLS